ncbi:MAG: P27 family phage terminase small subunit [Acidobacteriota bacterium]
MRIAPQHLTPKSRKFWAYAAGNFELEEQHLLLLTEACEALDLKDKAAALVEKHGLLVEDRYGKLKQNPAVAVVAVQRNALKGILRELDLDFEPPAGTRSGPPGLRSNR